MARDLDADDRAELARLRSEQKDLRDRGFHLSARWKQEEIDTLTGEEDD